MSNTLEISKQYFITSCQSQNTSLSDLLLQRMIRKVVGDVSYEL